MAAPACTSRWPTAPHFLCYIPEELIMAAGRACVSTAGRLEAELVLPVTQWHPVFSPLMPHSNRIWSTQLSASDRLHQPQTIVWMLISDRDSCQFSCALPPGVLGTSGNVVRLAWRQTPGRCTCTVFVQEHLQRSALNTLFDEQFCPGAGPGPEESEVVHFRVLHHKSVLSMCKL